MKAINHVCAVLLLGLVGSASAASSSDETPATLESLAQFAGIYRNQSGSFISAAIFDPGDGENRLLFTDFGSGLIRVMSPVSGETFSAGPGLLVPSPIEMRLTFHRNGAKQADSVDLLKEGVPKETATRVNCRRENVTFRNGELSLSGTVITPPGSQAHPAVIFLHGSGALNR